MKNTIGLLAVSMTIGAISLTAQSPQGFEPMSTEPITITIR